MLTLLINEIFYSIQGESTWAGLPCVFVRLTGCHLRCAYCDTEYAFFEGKKREISDILRDVESISGSKCDLIEITGGEPLLQPNVHDLMRTLCDQGKTVLLETDGACDISVCDPRIIRIMDLKTPGSGEADRNLWDNLNHLTPRDEIKFVLCSREDYEWSRQLIRQHELDRKVKSILMSAAAPMKATKEIAGVAGLAMVDLAKWILQDHLPVRMQTQLHKLIWDPMAKGV